MPPARAVLLLLVIASAFTLSFSSRWLSDHELFFEDPVRGAGVYNSVADNLTKLSYSKPNKTKISYSDDLKYVAECTFSPEAYRHPMHTLFSVVIRDIARNISHSIGVNDSVSVFEWSRGSAFAFELNEKDRYYTSAPGEVPIKIDADSALVLNSLRSKSVMNPGKATGDVIGFWFSPSDKYLAYPSSDDSKTMKAIMTTYERSEKYDYQYKMDYFQTGEEQLGVSSIFMWNSEENKSIKMNVQIHNISSMFHLIGSSWVVLHGKELLALTWTNRWFNHTTITLCSYDAASCWMLYEHKYEPRQWADYPDKIVYSDSSIFVLLPTRKDNNSWQHVHEIVVTTDHQLEYISEIPSGEYDISRIIEYRPNEEVVVYEAQAPHPWNRHIYAAHGEHLSGPLDQCLTCGFSQCSYQTGASISSSDLFKVAFTCNGPMTPYNSLMFLDIDKDGVFARSETRFITTPATSEYPKWKIDTFRLSSGYDAIVQIYEGDLSLPSVPVTLHVYGGPDQNKVTDEYLKDPDPIGYKHAIVHIDVRGSGGRGWNYRSEIYGRLVTVEVEDTLEAMQMVLERYPRFDKNRVGVDGWSYGGTMALALVEKAPQSFFKCAISGAPVTNFLYYWATYAERHMGDAPASAYTDLTEDVNKFNTTKLLLVHGLRDDRVHFRHSAVLAERLQQADIPFEFMVYPNQDHGVILKLDHVSHLYSSFLEKCYE